MVAVLVWSGSTVRGAGLLIADGGLGGILEIQEHRVEVTLNNGIAVTEVTQVFRNIENRPVEALYTFPVPKGASVADFSMWINGQEMVGEVVEKARARQVYESYKPRRKDPGLLEQKDYKTFEMRIFPIGPGAEQKVRLRYYQELEVDDDVATYVYPLSTTTTGAPAATAGRFSLTVHARSLVPIASMESPSHGEAFVIVGHDDTYFQASLESRRGDLGRDFVLACHLTRPRTGLDVIASKPSNEDGYLCVTLTAGEELAAKRSGMDYVFILDVSGSMAEENKLGHSRRGITGFTETLGADDRFEVIAFNVVPQALFGGLREVTAERQAEAARFLAAQTAKGGTELRSALAAAYRLAEPNRTLNVVFLSDGLADQGDRQALLAMIRQRPAGSRVFCIGVGNDVNRALLEQMAEDSGGLASFVSLSDNLQRQAEAFRRKLIHPAASELTLSVEGGGVYDVEPAKLPNLYHGTPLRIYARYRGAGPTTIAVRGNVNGTDVAWTAKADLPAKDDANPEIERMWAWHRVQRLLKDADRAGSRESVVAEVVRLGEAYSIATEHTSFIVLENDGEYKRWAIERRSALRLQRDRQAREVLARQLETIRDKAVAKQSAERAAPTLSDLSSTDAEANAGSPAKANPAQASSDSPHWNWPNLGGGPVGPVGVAFAAVLVVAELLRRRKVHR
jgi:Ca-activated chloride channel family protein